LKIAVIHGQQHKGSTYNITKLFLNKLAGENREIVEFFMPRDTPPSCVGCCNCFMKGELKCPHAEIVQPVVRAIEEADLVILDSPCYVLGMTGQLKTFLDHMGYRWMPHRPHPQMFRKIGLAVSTAAGAGAKKVTKELRRHFFYWGIPKSFSYAKNIRATNWEMVPAKKKARIEKEVTRLAAKILKRQGKVKPGMKTKAIFKLMGLMQKSNDWNPADREHWVKNGWLSGKNPW
jgi:multimeric flavodoxin WrbA